MTGSLHMIKLVVGCDTIDLAWDELTSAQADRLIAKLQEQITKITAAGKGGAQ